MLELMFQKALIICPEKFEFGTDYLIQDEKSRTCRPAQAIDRLRNISGVDTGSFEAGKRAYLAFHEGLGERLRVPFYQTMYLFHVKLRQVSFMKTGAKPNGLDRSEMETLP